MKKLARSWAPWFAVILSFAVVFGASVGNSTPQAVGGHKFSVQHPCSGLTYHFQCAANAPGQVTQKGVAGAGALPGIDFGWGGPSGSQAKAGGLGFAASYLSDSSKDWSYSNLQSYKVAGLGIVFVWESSATRGLDGYAAGEEDARSASAEEAELGFPGAFTYFGDDFDSTFYSCTALCPYFEGADHVDGVDRVGDYGGLHTVETLEAAKDVSQSWQTIAWSGGVWSPYACLRQISINNYFDGQSVDNDRAVCSNYGQYDYTPPGPSPATVKGWTKGRTSSLSAYQHRGCTKPVLVGPTSCHTYARRVVYFQGRLDSSGAQRRPRCFGPDANVAAPLCAIERPAVVIWGRAKRTTQAVANSYCFASPAWGHINVRECGILTQRVKYFQARIHSYLY